MMLARPVAGEYSPFFAGYLARVPEGDVLSMLRQQGDHLQALFRSVPEAKGDFAYAPGKWTVKRVLQHIVDGERLFGYRAMCIARGEAGDLPGFDENAYADHDGSETRTLASIVAEHAAVRRATSLLFDGLSAAALQRIGRANGHAISVRALVWITAGHELHHLAVLRERYGLGG
jgi:hypothetical protein